MRIGSRVAIAFMDDGQYIVPALAIIGTVIHVENGGDRDGFESISDVTIRWDDGRIERRELQGDDWELQDVTPVLYANIYLHDRAYGGPEEGGWWYDTYSPIDGDSDWDTAPPQHGHFPNEEKATQAMGAITRWCNAENSLRRSPSSVTSEGHYVVVMESWPAEFSPKQRPHYC